MAIRKTTNNLVINSLLKAREAIKNALIDADCNEYAANIVDRKQLVKSMDHLLEASKRLERRSN